MASQQDLPNFTIQWNNFQAHALQCFQYLRNERSFADITVAADGQFLKAHKIVLSACSGYMKDMIDRHPAKHPIIILTDVSFEDLSALVEFMYMGEVCVTSDALPSFLEAAEKLQVKALMDVQPGEDIEAGGKTKPKS